MFNKQENINVQKYNSFLYITGERCYIPAKITVIKFPSNMKIVGAELYYNLMHRIQQE